MNWPYKRHIKSIYKYLIDLKYNQFGHETLQMEKGVCFKGMNMEERVCYEELKLEKWV